MKTLFFITLITVFFVACLGDNAGIQLGKNEIKTINKKYSSEVLNYFYETVFYSESLNAKTKNTIRWTKSPKIAILGYPSKEEVLIIGKVIKQINELNLPINYSLVSTESEANIKIYFDKNNKFNSLFTQKNILGNEGTSRITSTDGVITEAAIYFPEGKEKSLRGTLKALIAEELIQTLGINGDSYSYTNSIFYQGKSYIKDFTEIDKSVIKLLYDPLLPTNYSVKNFESAFTDKLYSVNTSQKVKKYIAENKINMNVLKKVKENFFINEIAYKHQKEINVFLDGQYEYSDAIQLSKIIESLNKLHANLQLTIHLKSDSKTDSGIFFNFKQTKVLPKLVDITNATSQGAMTMLPVRFRNDIEVLYVHNKQSTELRNKRLVETMYQSLGPYKWDNIQGLFHEEKGEIIFGDDYKNMLKLFYSNSFANGYSLNEFEDLINDIK